MAMNAPALIANLYQLTMLQAYFDRSMEDHHSVSRSGDDVIL